MLQYNSNSAYNLELNVQMESQLGVKEKTRLQIIIGRTMFYEHKRKNGWQGIFFPLKVYDLQFSSNLQERNPGT